MNKQEYHEGTLKMVEECRKEEKPYHYNILGQDLIVLPGVFSPKYFKDTEFFAKEVPKHVKGESFLEIGSATGVVSKMVAGNENVRKIVATDRNPYGVKNTILNFFQWMKEHQDKYVYTTHLINNQGWYEFAQISRQRVNSFSAKDNKKIEILSSNVYKLKGHIDAPKSDTIFWNVPFGDYDDGTVKADFLKQAVFDPGHKNLEKFISGAPKHLKKNGNLLIGYSSTLGDYMILRSLLKKHGMTPPRVLTETGYEREGNKQVRFELFESEVKGR